MCPYCKYDAIQGSRRRGSPIRLETAALTPCFQLKYPLLCHQSSNWVKVQFWVNFGFKLWIDFEVKNKSSALSLRNAGAKRAECTATLENTSRWIKCKTNKCMSYDCCHHKYQTSSAVCAACIGFLHSVVLRFTFSDTCDIFKDVPFILSVFQHVQLQCSKLFSAIK